MKKAEGIGFFQRYLSLWGALCMVAGVLIGKLLPGVPAFLNQFEYAKVSIPMAILIWLMIYPMMMKADFQSIKNVGKNPKGLFATWIINWLIKATPRNSTARRHLLFHHSFFASPSFYQR